MIPSRWCSVIFFFFEWYLILYIIWEYEDASPVQCCFLFMAVNGEGHRIAKSEDIIIQPDDDIWS